VSIRNDDIVMAPFQRFLEALLRKLLKRPGLEETVQAPTGAEGEAFFGIPISVLDAMDVTSVSRILSNPRYLEAYAAIVATRGEPAYARLVLLLEAALKNGHPEPARLQSLISALG
jgi:hypothetical protein